MKCSECIYFAIQRAKKDYGEHAMKPILEWMENLMPQIPDAVVVWNQYSHVCLKHCVEGQTSRWHESNFSDFKKQ